jgi:hypothetical protein
MNPRTHKVDGRLDSIEGFFFQIELMGANSIKISDPTYDLKNTG